MYEPFYMPFCFNFISTNKHRIKLSTKNDDHDDRVQSMIKWKQNVNDVIGWPEHVNRILNNNL